LSTSKALTKIQSIILIAVIAVAALGGAAYVWLSGESQSSDSIKIGVLCDLDGSEKETFQGVKLAAEQINAEGGILGRQVEVIGEDHDGGVDPILTTTALNKLITNHKVDFLIGGTVTTGLTVQEIIAQHKKIFISVTSIPEMCEQQVLDDYDKYKYYFAVGFNESSVFPAMTNSIVGLRQNTGFNKIGYIGIDGDWINSMMDELDASFLENGFETVYRRTYPPDTMDFSSYFAAAEAAGVEVMITMIHLSEGIPFVKEWYDRQSPIFLFGGYNAMASSPDSYEWTDGKCEDTCITTSPIGAGYPFTSKTLPTLEAYIERWGETPTTATGYEILRFILADAIERAGTIETEAVIKALEETSVETANARNFVFTPSHGVMRGTDPNDPEADFPISLTFQWQNGKLVPVDPTKIMEEAGATITFPDWPGPWDRIS
jgi:branched-chain amino acid transport system substrate-binding protein